MTSDDLIAGTDAFAVSTGVCGKPTDVGFTSLTRGSTIRQKEALESRQVSRRAVVVLLLASTLMATRNSAAAACDSKIVTLGTSLTARGGWQKPLAAALSADTSLKISVAVVAQPGATSSWGRGQIHRVHAENPSIVLVEFAANDAAVHNFISLARSRENIRAIISGLQDHPNRPEVYIMAMNPVHGSRGWARPYLAAYEEAHRGAAREFGAGFIDHRPAWGTLLEADRARVVPDGLHPEPEAAARLIVPTIVRSLVDKSCGKARPWRH